MIECKKFAEPSSFLDDDQFQIENYFHFDQPATVCQKPRGRWTLPGHGISSARKACITYPPRYRLLNAWKGLEHPCPCVAADSSGILDHSSTFFRLPGQRHRSQPPKFKAPASRFSGPCEFAEAVNRFNIPSFIQEPPPSTSDDITVLRQKLREASKRIRDQHNRLMAIQFATDDYSFMAAVPPARPSKVCDRLTLSYSTRERLEFALNKAHSALYVCRSEALSLAQENNKLRYMIKQVLTWASDTQATSHNDLTKLGQAYLQHGLVSVEHDAEKEPKYPILPQDGQTVFPPSYAVNAGPNDNSRYYSSASPNALSYVVVGGLPTGVKGNVYEDSVISEKPDEENVLSTSASQMPCVTGHGSHAKLPGHAYVATFPVQDGVCHSCEQNTLCVAYHRAEAARPTSSSDKEKAPPSTVTVETESACKWLPPQDPPLATQHGDGISDASNVSSDNVTVNSTNVAETTPGPLITTDAVDKVGVPSLRNSTYDALPTNPNTTDAPPGNTLSETTVAIKSALIPLVHSSVSSNIKATVTAPRSFSNLIDANTNTDCTHSPSVITDNSSQPFELELNMGPALLVSSHPNTVLISSKNDSVSESDNYICKTAPPYSNTNSCSSVDMLRLSSMQFRCSRRCARKRHLWLFNGTVPPPRPGAEDNSFSISPPKENFGTKLQETSTVPPTFAASLEPPFFATTSHEQRRIDSAVAREYSQGTYVSTTFDEMLNNRSKFEALPSFRSDTLEQPTSPGQRSVRVTYTLPSLCVATTAASVPNQASTTSLRKVTSVLIKSHPARVTPCRTTTMNQSAPTFLEDSNWSTRLTQYGTVSENIGYSTSY